MSEKEDIKSINALCDLYTASTHFNNYTGQSKMDTTCKNVIQIFDLPLHANTELPQKDTGTSQKIITSNFGIMNPLKSSLEEAQLMKSFSNQSIDTHVLLP